MDIKISTLKIEHLTKQRNMLSFLVVLLILSLLLLVIQSFSKDQKIILIPSEMSGSYEIDGNKFNDVYLIDRSNEVIRTILNITPANLTTSQEAVLRMVNPSSYSEVKKELEKISQKVNSHNITISFYPLATEVNTKSLTAKVMGEYRTSFGRVNKKEKKVFKLKFINTGSKLALLEFKEISNAKN